MTNIDIINRGTKKPTPLSKLVIFPVLYLRISTSWKIQNHTDQTECRVFL